MSLRHYIIRDLTQGVGGIVHPLRVYDGGIFLKRDSVTDIKNRLDIVEIVSDHVRLKKVGKNYRGLCPFHSEKTPSFYVSPDRQTYHCFGCGAGGDIFSFVMAAENLDFREALEMLASRAGVIIENKSSDTSGSSYSLYEIMNMAETFFAESLFSKSGIRGRKYLANRSVTGDMARSFRLGWAPAGWDNLWTFLKSKGISFRAALDAGLVAEGKHGAYDRFRGRVMFPVRDISGRVIAFGGRAVDEDGAKYINSPEGPIFHKRSSLYLVERAKKTISEKGSAIIVEGYMDALRLNVSGFTESVASLGTSLTEEQAKLLKRVADRVFICFDSDTAGQDATIRGMYVLQREGIDVNVVDLPRGKDPDELLLQEEGRRVFAESLKKAAPLVLYHLYIRKPRLAESGSYNNAVKELLDGISTLPMENLVPYMNHLSRELQILPHALQERILSIKSENQKNMFRVKQISEETDLKKISEAKKNNTEKDFSVDNIEAAFCYLLWKDGAFRKKMTSCPDTVTFVQDQKVKMIVCAIMSGDDPEELESVWHSTGEVLPMRVLAAGGAFLEELEGYDNKSEIIVSALKKRRSKVRFKEISSKLIKGIASEDEIREYLRIKQELKDIIF